MWSVCGAWCHNACCLCDDAFLLNFVLQIQAMFRLELASGAAGAPLADLSPQMRQLVDTTLFFLVDRMKEDNDKEAVARMFDVLAHWVRRVCVRATCPVTLPS
jgi:hypothetical protein